MSDGFIVVPGDPTAPFTSTNLQAINSMSQAKMQSLKNSEGKIPELANQLIMTDEEDVNLSQLRTELLWTNPNTTATFNEQTINVDLSKYDGYRVIFGFHTTTTTTFVQEFCKTDGVITALSYNSIFRRNITYSDDGLTFSMMEGYKIPGETIIQNNDYLIPYKIEGILKSPAMIYTGTELHEGNGIKIDNGAISSLLKGAMFRKLSADMSINTSVKTVNYDLQLASIGTGITCSGGYFIAGSGVTAMKFNFSNAFYNMTTVGYLQMNFRKNDTALSNYELWTFFDSGHSGSGGGTVLIPCNSGDKISIHVKMTTGTGYLNNNSYVEVEAF